MNTNIPDSGYFKTLLRQINKDNHFETGEVYLQKFKVLTKNAYDELNEFHLIKTKLFTSIRLFEISMQSANLTINDRQDLKSLGEIAIRSKKNLTEFNDFLDINFEKHDINYSKSKFFHGDKIIEKLMGKLISYYNHLLKECSSIIANENNINESIQNEDKRLRKYMKEFKKCNEQINELEAEKLWLQQLDKLKDQPFIKEINKMHKLINAAFEKTS